MSSRQKALAAARAAWDKQAEDIVVIDVARLSDVTDFFVLCTAESSRQLEAIREHVETTLLKHGWRVGHTEGHAGQAGQAGELCWLLMDCGDVVVHLMDPLARKFYQLERLWADAPRVPFEPAAAPARP